MLCTVKVEQNGEIHPLQAERGTLLSELLRREGMAVPMVCGGMGRCGKCHVQVNGRPALACRTRIQGDIRVSLPETRQNVTVAQAARGIRFPLTPGTGLGAAVDIGTTTVVLYLLDLETGRQLAVASGENSQRAFGADVLSRIQACRTSTGLAEQSGLIRGQIQSFLERACRKAGRMPEEVTCLSVAGNTVMEHLFAGLDPTSIGTAPFTPVSLFGTAAPAREFGLTAGEGAQVYLAPCVAGYVGGDITAGLLSCGIYREARPCLFLDLGTNGEMAVGNRDGFVTCAVAAGPAFEGGEIACGSTAGPGAIHRVWAEGGALRYSTVGNRAAVSLCGSGLLDLLALLLEAGAVDESGYFCPAEEYEGDLRLTGLGRDEDGVCLWLNPEKTVRFTARDVRKLQLAKAAVAAGIQTLLKETGLGEDDIGKVYLAGGFGSFLNRESACRLGLLPPSMLTRIESMGNSAGRGAVDWLLSSEARRELDRVAAGCRYLELSGDKTFGAYYVGCMGFEA